MKVIDAHVHLVQCIAGTGAAGEMRYCGEGCGRYADGSVVQLIPPALGDSQVTPEAVIALMDEYEVESAVLLQGNYIGFQNLYSYEAWQKYPDRFLAAAAYDPFSRDRDKIVRHLFEDLQIPVVKFEVSTGSGLMANHETLPLDGVLMEKEYAYADEHGLVFVIDIGKLGSASSQISALRRAILRHPSMRFVVCHLLAPKQGMEVQLWEGLEALKLPNVWFDLASLQNNLRPDPSPFPYTRSVIRHAADLLGADRLLFGSDLPTTLTRFSYRDIIDCIAQAPQFSLSEKQAILYDNARQVFWEH